MSIGYDGKTMVPKMTPGNRWRIFPTVWAWSISTIKIELTNMYVRLLIFGKKCHKGRKEGNKMKHQKLGVFYQKLKMSQRRRSTFFETADKPPPTKDGGFWMDLDQGKIKFDDQRPISELVKGRRSVASDKKSTAELADKSDVFAANSDDEQEEEEDGGGEKRAKKREELKNREKPTEKKSEFFC